MAGGNLVRRGGSMAGHPQEPAGRRDDGARHHEFSAGTVDRLARRVELLVNGSAFLFLILILLLIVISKRIKILRTIKLLRTIKIMIFYFTSTSRFRRLSVLPSCSARFERASL